jgi:integrase
MYASNLSLYSSQGQRKYLNAIERARFLARTEDLRLDRKLFCQILYYTGARIGEVHNLLTTQIDPPNHIVFETLKKRRKGIFRAVPVPELLIAEINDFIHLRWGAKRPNNPSPLWGFSRRSATRYVKKVMRNAGINGVMASAKGLRHGFAVDAVSKVPITLVKKWLGHANLETTEIYLNISGHEEMELAQRLWRKNEYKDSQSGRVPIIRIGHSANDQ